MASEVAAAARKTLATDSARIRQVRFREAEGEGREAVSTEVGVTDFAAVRTRVEQHLSDAVRRAQAMAERYPWLGEEQDEPAGEAPPVMVFAGTASFFGAGGRWTVIGAGDVDVRRRRHPDPAWIVEALQQVSEAAPRGPGQYEFVLDPDGTGLEVPPWRGRLTGDVALDGEGRIGRVDWTVVPRRRPRSPVRVESGARVVTTVELWDFGVAADIEVPDVGRDRMWPVRLAQVAWDLRRRKRAHAAGETR